MKQHLFVHDYTSYSWPGNRGLLQLKFNCSSPLFPGHILYRTVGSYSYNRNGKRLYLSPILKLETPSGSKIIDACAAPVSLLCSQWSSAVMYTPCSGGNCHTVLHTVYKILPDHLQAKFSGERNPFYKWYR